MLDFQLLDWCTCQIWVITPKVLKTSKKYPIEGNIWAQFDSIFIFWSKRILIWLVKKWSNQLYFLLNHFGNGLFIYFIYDLLKTFTLDNGLFIHCNQSGIKLTTCSNQIKFWKQFWCIKCSKLENNSFLRYLFNVHNLMDNHKSPIFGTCWGYCFHSINAAFFYYNNPTWALSEFLSYLSCCLK